MFYSGSLCRIYFAEENWTQTSNLISAIFLNILLTQNYSKFDTEFQDMENNYQIEYQET